MVRRHHKKFPVVVAELLIIIVCSAAAEESNEKGGSIYDHLQRNGLPMGLFPKGITEFWVEQSTGLFEVKLRQPCDAKLENQLHYDFNVTGVLSYGKIRELRGVEQQELFLWFPVKAIRVDVPNSGLIYFDVGVVDKRFSLSLFEDPFDCSLDPPSGFGPHRPQNHLKMLVTDDGQRNLRKAV